MISRLTQYYFIAILDKKMTKRKGFDSDFMRAIQQLCLLYAFKISY